MNPYMPRVRMKAVNLVRSGWGIRKTARYVGCSPGTITKWCEKAKYLNNRYAVPTASSRPHHSPKRIPDTVRDAIVTERLAHYRCGDVIQKVLEYRGIKVSTSTVNRVLDRGQFLKKKSKWKRLWKNTPRPVPQSPGDLVETDTIHYLPYWFRGDMTKWYIYTAIDLNCRWAYTEVFKSARPGSSLQFLRNFRAKAAFQVQCIQSDNGPEYGRYFSLNAGTRHRKIRKRKPNDNAHIEKFNRTLREECIFRRRQIPANREELQQWIDEYLEYYNEERLHMGINYKTPSQVLAQVFPRS
ncbi:MAG: integrase core domain-containing protein [Patescibacteria group bacterium]